LKRGPRGRGGHSAKVRNEGRGKRKEPETRRDKGRGPRSEELFPLGRGERKGKRVMKTVARSICVNPRLRGVYRRKRTRGCW